MADAIDSIPVTLQVFRYEPKRRKLRVIVGRADAPVPGDEVLKRAREALRRRSFVCQTVAGKNGGHGDEVCLIPKGDFCEIVSISANGWQRHHGDHRRSLIDILNELAAAVARGRLHFMDDDELAHESTVGEELITRPLGDSRALTEARRAADLALKYIGLDRENRERIVLCVSEAATNVLLHAGGAGQLTLRLLDRRLRAIVADAGPGLNFFNWMQPQGTGDQASMGYGYKIILDNLDEVYLHTGDNGTTLIFDQEVNRKRV